MSAADRASSSRSGSLLPAQPFRLGPGAPHWTSEWKLAFFWGCTEASVPSGRWRPGLEVWGSAPEEERAGGTGEAWPKLQQPHGSKAVVRGPGWRTPRAAACDRGRHRKASEVPAAPVAWLPSVLVALPGWALGLPQRAKGPLYTPLPGGAAGRAGSVPSLTGRGGVEWGGAGCRGQDTHGGAQEPPHAASSSQPPEDTPERNTSLPEKLSLAR